jgi:hypothetical protein
MHGRTSHPWPGWADRGGNAPGLMVMAIIITTGGVPGAHLNPGVSIVFALRGDFGTHRHSARTGIAGKNS